MNATNAWKLLESSSLNNIDKDKVYNFIGEGWNHVVFTYNDNQVLKVPKKKGDVAHTLSQLMLKDLSLIKKYFPGLAPATEIYISSDKSDYVLVQDLCQGHEISGKITTRVRSQLKYILKQNKHLYKMTGRSLDLFGSTGFITSLLAMVIPGIKPQLSNILMKKVGRSYQLFLVDTELLHLRVSSLRLSSFSLWIQSWTSYYLTSFLLRNAFKFASA